jgi:sugar lactone lactonase YvrE
VRKNYQLRKIARAQADLGESPVWNERQGLLYFIDISAGRINALTSQGHLVTVHQSTGRIGAMALTDKGNLIFTEDASAAIFDVDTSVVRQRTIPVRHATSYRFNDGACDPQGRFVTGLMDESPSHKTGALYRFDRELNAKIIRGGMALPNGLTWSEDGRLLFFVDSVARSIFRAEYLADDALGRVSLFAQTPAELGRPDGIALDRAEGLWVCQFNGSCLLRYDSVGRLSSRIDLPVPRPTSCCFGGEGLETLYITTARFAMTAAELANYPDAGDLYAISPEISGIPRHLFKE